MLEGSDPAHALLDFDCRRPADHENVDCFTLLSAGNLPSIAVGHEHKMVLDFEDRDHITERWTWRKNGKDTDMV